MISAQYRAAASIICRCFFTFSLIFPATDASCATPIFIITHVLFTQKRLLYNDTVENGNYKKISISRDNLG